MTQSVVIGRLGLAKDSNTAEVADESHISGSEQSLSYPPWGLCCLHLSGGHAYPPCARGFHSALSLNIIDENTGGLSTVSYKKGRIIKDTACRTREDDEDDASLLNTKTPSEAPSPMPANYRKQSGPGSAADAKLNGSCSTGYLMPNITDIPDMPESDL
ncbi:sodium-dependent neutral amino acid transporter B(0)AT2-like [Danio aesculapii]|uniref:sodium-dependent neutral amino acid transporter B(0)AT2-like n=1 Tax=Danio aesculapii TaxID=1142201 RepID=UPI0024C0B416|nr:sodium-dependent neutral amino acid transporter B(0)AT2-like [Danio aesculapii]